MRQARYQSNRDFEAGVMDVTTLEQKGTSETSINFEKIVCRVSVIHFQHNSFRFSTADDNECWRIRREFICSCSALAHAQNPSLACFVSSLAAARIVNIVPASGAILILLLWQLTRRARDERWQSL